MNTENEELLVYEPNIAIPKGFKDVKNNLYRWEMFKKSCIERANHHAEGIINQTKTLLEGIYNNADMIHAKPTDSHGPYTSHCRAVINGKVFLFTYDHELSGIIIRDRWNKNKCTLFLVIDSLTSDKEIETIIQLLILKARQTFFINTQIMI